MNKSNSVKGGGRGRGSRGAGRGRGRAGSRGGTIFKLLRQIRFFTVANCFIDWDGFQFKFSEAEAVLEDVAEEEEAEAGQLTALSHSFGTITGDDTQSAVNDEGQYTTEEHGTVQTFPHYA